MEPHFGEGKRGNENQLIDLVGQVQERVWWEVPDIPRSGRSQVALHPVPFDIGVLAVFV